MAVCDSSFSCASCWPRRNPRRCPPAVAARGELHVFVFQGANAFVARADHARELFGLDLERACACRSRCNSASWLLRSPPSGRFRRRLAVSSAFSASRVRAPPRSLFRVARTPCSARRSVAPARRSWPWSGRARRAARPFPCPTARRLFRRRRFLLLLRQLGPQQLPPMSRSMMSPCARRSAAFCSRWIARSSAISAPGLQRVPGILRGAWLYVRMHLRRWLDIRPGAQGVGRVVHLPHQCGELGRAAIRLIGKRGNCEGVDIDRRQARLERARGRLGRPVRREYLGGVGRRAHGGGLLGD